MRRVTRRAVKVPKQQEWTKEHVDLLKNGVVGLVRK